MDKDIIALEKNETLYLTQLPANKKVISSKWVYKIKYLPGENVERYKAGLVVVGYQQVEGTYYTHSFSPIAKTAIVEVIISLETAKGWHLCQLDINNAFLHGLLDQEVVFMKPPLGCKRAKPGEVCRLKRSLYGLKQASRQ